MWNTLLKDGPSIAEGCGGVKKWGGFVVATSPESGYNEKKPDRDAASRSMASGYFAR
jgi:hypothetical protein